MVFRNFFITFVRHSFHTSPHPAHPPLARDGIALHRPTTRHHTPLMAHALHIAKGYAHAPRTRHASSSLTAHTPPHYNPRKGLCHMRCSPSQHTRPPHYNPHKGLCSRATHPSSLTAHTPPTLQPPQRAMPRTRPRTKMPQCFPLQPPPF